MRKKQYGPGPIESLKNLLFSNTKYDRDRKHNAPKPLPNKRPRSLTLHYPTATQPTSSLLSKLPSEIRSIIWQYCMSDQHMHVVRCPKRLASRTCHYDPAANPERCPHHSCWGQTKSGAITSWRSESRSVPTLQPFPLRRGDSLHTPFALLMTCRAVYRETVALLYTDTLLDMNHIDTIIYLRQTILPVRFHAIRHVRLDWCLTGEPYTWRSPDDIEFHDQISAPYDMATWRSACGVLAEMRGLEDLCVFIRCSTTPRWLNVDSWGPLLDPLTQVREECVMEVILQKVSGHGLAEELDAFYRFKVTEIPW